MNHFICIPTYNTNDDNSFSSSFSTFINDSSHHNNFFERSNSSSDSDGSTYSDVSNQDLEAMKRMVRKINQDPNLIPEYFPELDSSPESLKMVDLSIDMSVMMARTPTTKATNGKSVHASSTRSRWVSYIIVLSIGKSKRAASNFIYVFIFCMIEVK